MRKTMKSQSLVYKDHVKSDLWINTSTNPLDNILKKFNFLYVSMK